MKKRMRNFLMIVGMGAVLFSSAALAEGSESVSGTETVTVTEDGKEATIAENGNTEYWYCTTCSKYFSDQAGHNEISLEDTAPVKADNEAPKTDDDSNIGLSLAFLFISGSLLIMISRFGRKESMQ